MFKMKYWEQLLENDIRRRSIWLIMSDRKVKQREERWMLMYTVTLGEVALFMGLIAKSNQFGWWTVPTKFSLSLLEVLGTLQIMDYGGSWIKIMSKCDCVSRMVLTIRWFFWMFWERILKFFKIIFSACYFPKSKLIWSCCHRFQRILSSVILC